MIGFLIMEKKLIETLVLRRGFKYILGWSFFRVSKKRYVFVAFFLTLIKGFFYLKSREYYYEYKLIAFFVCLLLQKYFVIPDIITLAIQ